MSIFRPIPLPCPRCHAEATFDAVGSVNADRRPDLRDAILSGEFQRKDCMRCGAQFRLDTDFSYLDVGRGQWIAAAPVSGLNDWKLRETVARELFARAYGDKAPAAAVKIGRKLAPRITFGWPALREKLRARQHNLDDVTLEACKASVMRRLPELPFGADNDLRLIDVTSNKLVLAWVRPADSGVGEMLGVPRKLYDDIAADSAWDGWREDYAGALFVDLNRELVAQPN
jgi:hypothetical protein